MGKKKTLKEKLAKLTSTWQTVASDNSLPAVSAGEVGLHCPLCGGLVGVRFAVIAAGLVPATKEMPVKPPTPVVAEELES